MSKKSEIEKNLSAKEINIKKRIELVRAIQIIINIEYALIILSLLFLFIVSFTYLTLGFFWISNVILFYGVLIVPISFLEVYALKYWVQHIKYKIEWLKYNWPGENY